MNKLAVTAASAALLLASVVPAFAANNVYSIANSGINFSQGGNILTGYSDSNGKVVNKGKVNSSNTVVSVANSGVNFSRGGSISTSYNAPTVSNGAVVNVGGRSGSTSNTVVSVANSGGNFTSGTGTITTGGSSSNGVIVNVVNTRINN
ncbi:MAG TPA: hypothetical protein VMR41_00590 [Patescibacteria group bacterium]|nr:hypothetical protein [Patescibacteria group bacterium]